MLSPLISSSATEIVASVIIAVAAFLLGTFRKAIARRIRTRATRRYWEPLRSRGLAIVLGSFSDPPGNRHREIDVAPLHEFEPYGLVGFGDVVALITVQNHLKTLGWKDVVVAQPLD